MATNLKSDGRISEQSNANDGVSRENDGTNEDHNGHCTDGSRRESSIRSPSPEAPKAEGVTLSTQTEWVTRRLRKKAVLSNYMRVIRYDHQEQIKRRKSSRDTAKTTNVAVIVKALMKKTVDSLRGRSKVKVLAPFEPKDGAQVMQVAEGLFKVRVMLEDPFPPGTFQLLTGLGNSLPHGKGLLSLNSQGLTLEERMEVTKRHRAFFDDAYLSPTKTTTWLFKGFEAICRSLHGEKVHGNSTYMYPYLITESNLSITIKMKHETTGEMNTVNVLVVPGILVAGWLSSASIIHPLPKHREYREHGKAMTDRIQNRIEAGDKLLCLEGSVSMSKQSAKSSRITQPKPPARSWSSVTLATTTASPPKASNMWNVNFGEVEQDMMGALMKLDSMKEAKLMYEVFGILQTCYPSWKVFSPELCRALMLASAKRVHILKGPDDWFLDFLTNVNKAIANHSCPQFFQPKVNMMAGMDRDSFKPMQKELKWYLKHIKEQPYVLAQMICDSNY